MRKKLSVIGNSLGIVIEKPILELLRITRDTEIEISTDGQRLILQPVREAKSAPVPHFEGALAPKIGEFDSGIRKKTAR